MEKTSKHFKKRDAILTCLRSTPEHPSADWIYAKLKPEYPDISLGTVYRNLTLFKQQGIISSLGTVSGVERFDANTDPHVHFVCKGCDSVSDLMQMEIPGSLSSQAQALSGGDVEACSLCFTGLCRECKSKENSGITA